MLCDTQHDFRTILFGILIKVRRFHNRLQCETFSIVSSNTQHIRATFTLNPEIEIMFSIMKARPRKRTLKRTFVLLRDNDSLRVPSTSDLKHLTDSGRVKELVFANTATSRHVTEIILHNFPALLTNGNISR